MPRMLSSGATNWFASGVTPFWSSFLPIFAQLRPRNDISNSLSAGPVASDARLAKRMTCLVPTSWPKPPPPVGGIWVMKTWLCGSPIPNTLPPLKSWRARPSQKLSKLLAVPKNVGVLRGSTRLMVATVWVAGSLNPGTGSVAAVRMSGVRGWTLVGLAGTWTKEPLLVPPGVGMSVNGLKTTPIEDATSSTSLRTLAASHTTRSPVTGCAMPATALTLATSTPTPSGWAASGAVHSGSPAMVGSASLWKGKSLVCRSYVLGAAPPWSSNEVWPPRVLGLTWFLVRLSAPAVKWQVPQERPPSLPPWMSHNSDLPSAAATARPSTSEPGPLAFHGYPRGAWPAGAVAVAAAARIPRDKAELPTT